MISPSSEFSACYRLSHPYRQAHKSVTEALRLRGQTWRVCLNDCCSREPCWVQSHLSEAIPFINRDRSWSWALSFAEQKSLIADCSWFEVLSLTSPLRKGFIADCSWFWALSFRSSPAEDLIGAWSWSGAVPPPLGLAAVAKWGPTPGLAWLVWKTNEKLLVFLLFDKISWFYGVKA